MSSCHQECHILILSCQVYTTSETHRDGRRGYTVMGEQGARILGASLKLRPGDRLVDVGAGTCVTAGH